MVFFEKITKCIAFARDFRYTVKRIAPATCRFCALLPKQPTPRQGTKTWDSYSLQCYIDETTYTPSGDENCVVCDINCVTDRNNLHPVRGRKPDKNREKRVEMKKQPTPRQGTKTTWWLRYQQMTCETTYTPSGDENE